MLRKKFIVKQQSWWWIRSESCSFMSDFSVTTWTVAHQAPLVHGIIQARLLEWVAILSSRGSS